MPAQHFLDFSGGLQNRTSRFLARPNELDVLVNGHTDVVGAIEKRPGFKKIGGTLQSGKAVRGVGSGGSYLFAGVNDGGDTTTQIKYITQPASGAWQDVTETGTVPAYAYPLFTPFPELRSGTLNSMGATIISGAKRGLLNSESDFIPTQLAYYDTPGTTAAIALAPASKYTVRFRDRPYHGYCARNSGWTGGGWYNETSGSLVRVKPNRVIYPNAPSNGTITYEDQGVSGYANFLDTDSDLTGMGIGPDQLLVWTANSMWIRSGDTVLTWKKRYNIGCDSYWSIANVDIYTLWFNRNGIFAYSGGKPQKISNKIQPIIDGIADPAAVFAACHDDDHYRLYVGTLTVAGRTFSNCVIQYTFSTNSWAVYSYTIPTGSATITSMGTFFDGTNNRVYFGTSSGQVHVLSEVDDATVIYSDGDQAGETYPIAFWARTQKLDFGAVTDLKDVTRIIVYSENAQNMNIRVSADTVSSDGSPRTIGQIHKEIEQFSVNPPQGYWHQFEFAESSTNKSLRFNGFSVNPQIRSNFLKQ